MNLEGVVQLRVAILHNCQEPGANLEVEKVQMWRLSVYLCDLKEENTNKS